LSQADAGPVQTGGVDEVLAAVGPRLRAIRRQRGETLASLAATTGISVSTLSRLESGQRRPTLELLLTLAKAYQVPLDELVDSPPPPADPRVRPKPITRDGMTIVPLTRQQTGPRAFRSLLPGGRSVPDPRVHEGYEWLYVLNGRLRLVLGDQDIVLRSGEAAEFDTRVPHWFGNADDRPVEMLSLFGPQGERMHVRARSVSRDERPPR
jgi:transcriptional regulator with XRE-family HTH domain